MLNRTLTLYRSSFAGLSREIWLLSLIMFINRMGAMVIPFLSVYLTQQQGFSLKQTGIVMSCFGAGSVLGNLLGGKLTDLIGYYKIPFWSLFLTGAAFLVLERVDTFPMMCIMVFVLSTIADTFRPATQAAIAAYSTMETRTRAISLVRLAMNAGFSTGPAIGGFLAMSLGWEWLFRIDGLTCITAGFLFIYLLEEKIEPKEEVDVQSEGGARKRSAYRDLPFLIFVGLSLISAIVFLQILTALLVFFREEVFLSESQIGLLMAFNGFLILLTEMPLVHTLEQRFSRLPIIAVGTLFVGASYLIFLPLGDTLLVSIGCILLFTIGEMLKLPFANSVALHRSTPATRGEYMGLYGMAFSVALIIAPIFGMELANLYGFHTLWLICGILSIGVAVGLLLLQWNLKTENSSEPKT